MGGGGGALKCGLLFTGEVGKLWRRSIRIYEFFAFYGLRGVLCPRTKAANKRGYFATKKQTGKNDHTWEEVPLLVRGDFRHPPPSSLLHLPRRVALDHLRSEIPGLVFNKI